MEKKANKPKKKKSLFSRVNAWLHLWLGLVAGIILFFVAITGTIIVYCDEILEWTAGDARFVTEVKSNTISINDFINEFKQSHPTVVLSDVVRYKDPKRALRFRAFDKAKGLIFMYVDPYSGKVLKMDHAAQFFFIVAHLHASFMWHGVGDWIVDIATIIFLIELISGIVLWWPKKWNKHTRDASFKVKWDANFKRVNYDLHNVFGFYSCLLALILTVTGLFIAFRPLEQQVTKLFGGDPKPTWKKQMPTLDTLQKSVAYNVAMDEALQRNPSKEIAHMWLFKIDSVSFYEITTATKVGLKSFENASVNYFNKYTNQELKIPPKNLQVEVIENYIWQLHMGTWQGQLGKLLTFLCGLICASLPVTGFIIWYLKGKKKPQKKSVA